LKGTAGRRQGGAGAQAAGRGVPRRAQRDAGADRGGEGLREPRRNFGCVPTGVRALSRAHHLLGGDDENGPSASLATSALPAAYAAYASVGPSVAASHLDRFDRPGIARRTEILSVGELR